MKDQDQQTDLFQQIFFTHYPSVRRKLTYLVKDCNIADDLAQEVFLKLYRNPPDDLHVVGAWLHRVLTRMGYDYLNKQARGQALQARQIEQILTSGCNEPSGEDVVIQKLSEEKVRQWLDELPDRDRKVLLLRYSGYSYAEIADEMQVKQSFVGMFIQRATSRLKRLAGEC